MLKNMKIGTKILIAFTLMAYVDLSSIMGVNPAIAAGVAVAGAIVDSKT